MALPKVGPLPFNARMVTSERFYKTLAIAVFAYVFVFLIADWNANWVHPETMNLYFPAAIENGKEFQLKDLARGMDWKTFDGAPRARFLNYSLLILNLKFRLWLFKYVPPHPSFSLIWFFAFVSLWMLYRLVKLLTEDGAAAWGAVALYLASSGFLSGVQFLFHPAKPLTNVFFIGVLWLGAILSKKFSYRIYAALLLLLFTGSFLDETALFAFALVPLAYFNLFRSERRWNWKVIAWFPSPIVVYLLFITFVAPLMTRALGFGDFPVWDWTYKSNDGFSKMALSHFLGNAFYFFSTHWVPSRQTIEHFRFFNWVWFLGLIALFIALWARSQARELRWWLILFAFVVWETLILTRYSSPVIKFTYYYGAPFSLFLSLAVAESLCRREALWAWPRRVVTLGLIAIALNNFHWINNLWMGKQIQDGKISLSWTREVWQRRADSLFLEEQKKKFPYRVQLFLREIQEISQN